MPASPERLEILRDDVTRAIHHGTDLLADLNAIADGLEALEPRIADLTEAERLVCVARLVGFDRAMPERLSEMVESLADVLAGLTATDGGAAWLAQRRGRLESGDEEDAAAA